MKKLTFLFGSGISLSANLPNVSTITNELLTKDFFYSGYGDHVTYPQRNTVHKYKKFLKKLSNYCVSLNLNNSYEDLFYITTSIQDSLDQREFGNFYVNYFINSIKFVLTEIIDEKNKKNNKNDINSAFKQFIFELNVYIQKFVAKKLRPSENNVYINSFISKLKDEYSYNIFTLNHDLLLETGLKEKEKEKGIYVNTGFGKNNKFSIDNFKDTSSQFNIFKLHGSINWNRGKDVNRKDYIFETDSSTPFNKHTDTSPYFIMGTFNKYELYTYGIFYDLFHEFRVRLSKTNTLYICGYGFRDEGVNSVLLEWMEKDSNNKIKIFHKDKQNLISNSNVFTGWEWDKRIAKKQIKIIKKYFENIEWKDIVNSL